MPKTARNLWESILAWDNLVCAAKDASRHKRFHGDVLRFNARREEHLIALREQLCAGTWKPGPFREFVIYEPKRRVIHAPAFSDRVVHHALIRVIGPFFERRFIDHSFACRVGKGTHAASLYLSHMLQSAAVSGPVFVLKADVTNYFHSIDHETLLDIVSRIIGDRKVLRVLRALVTECGCIEGNRGLPLGALTSQVFANAYLDRLDHYVKDELGIRYYLRYMDDFVILGHDKAALWRLLAHIRDFLVSELRLTLNHKTRIFPASHGVDFAGYRHWATHRLPRKRNVRRAKRRFAGLSRCYADGRVELDIVRSCMASFVGYIRHCKGWRSAGSALDKLVLVRSNPEK